MKISCAALLLLFMISLQALSLPAKSYHPIQVNTDDGPQNVPPPQIDCSAACSKRCQLSSRPNLCHRGCGTCCKRCNCVPPGTSGNYDACFCYANMTTHGGRRKCP